LLCLLLEPGTPIIELGIHTLSAGGVAVFCEVMTDNRSQEFEQYGFDDYRYAAARAVDHMEKPRAA
jgi:hypothetical protein